jgi:hypothetical protein
MITGPPYHSCIPIGEDKTIYIMGFPCVPSGWVLRLTSKLPHFVFHKNIPLLRNETQRNFFLFIVYIMALSDADNAKDNNQWI